MTKSPRFNRRIKRRASKGQPENTAKLIRSHNRLIKFSWEFFSSMAMDIISLLNGGSFDKLYVSSFHSSHIFLFNACFEKAYGSILESYGRIADLCRYKAEDTNEGLNREILGGISDILLSRRKEYAEIAHNLNSDRELTEIANNALLNYISQSKALMVEKTCFIMERVSSLAIKASWDINEENIEDYKNLAQNCLLDILAGDLYHLYRESVKSAAALINKNSCKGNLDLKLSLIKQECEILASVVRVQGPKLETAGQDGQLINQAMAIARECYRHAGKSLDYLESVYPHENKGPRSNYLSFDEFKKELKSISASLGHNKAGFLNGCALHRSSFQEIFQAIIGKHLDNVESASINSGPENFISLQLKQDISLSTGIMALFGEAANYTGKFDAIPNDEASIISGIKETVEIKVQSIGENLNLYRENMEKEKRRAREKPNKIFSETDKKNAYTLLLPLWSKSFPHHIDSDYNSCLTVCKFFSSELKEFEENLVSKYNDRSKLQKEKILKLSANFKRENILFEISTFEEILHYSVSRLKESKNQEVLSCAYFIEDTYARLVSFLSRHGISQIAPVPGDMFNAREHEVLMAKTEDGFSRGMVIKVLNRGYIQNGKVLLRANVVAAK